MLAELRHIFSGYGLLALAGGIELGGTIGAIVAALAGAVITQNQTQLFIITAAGTAVGVIAGVLVCLAYAIRLIKQEQA